LAENVWPLAAVKRGGKKASVIALPPIVDALHMPSVSEAVLVDNVR
jgi:hypothetical protein